MLIVDVRRTDYEGGAIRGSLNIPAQGFWWNRGTQEEFLSFYDPSAANNATHLCYLGMLYELCYKADIEWVVFTCGSSNGRGPRCASWFLEHVRNTAEDEDMQVMVLEGGVKGWVKAGPQFTQFMDGFKPEFWEQLFSEEEKSKEGKADTAAARTGDDTVGSAVVTSSSVT
ncbi:hypothetical protein LTR62_001043 [Meristemomyces frigidus]|uniref:Rhodanese domain-containing protein n=1 Tax=Meristemomyces frigidus TaxID=1508187 RepID=A0AAN7T8Q1_9PEZI|nr:hypothetical protein LTR62_001043 [Meristemomyces frigidus]